MIPLWVVYTIISGLASVVFNFISRKVLKDDQDSSSYSWWFEFLRFLIFIPFSVNLLYLIFSFNNFILFLAIGICEFLAIYFYMKMHANADLSVSSVITQLRLILVPIFAFAILSEKLSYKSYLGIIVILIGQIVVAVNNKFKLKDSIDKGIKYALIATVLVSLNNVLAKSGANIFPPQIITLAMATPSIFLFPILMKNSKKRIISLGKSKGKKILLAALFNAVTMIFIILAYKVGNVGKVTALFQSMVIIQVFMGILFLNENKNILRKIIGSVVVLIGVYFLI